MNASTYTSFDTEFTDKDREHLELNFRLADTIADFIGPHCDKKDYSRMVNKR